ncbi:MAG TPA: DsrE family protein [Ottowia sp.]|uniref:DsrE family protein n=1 Tax=Ottowia sp. TaxID=1898956 RepID=UPI002C93B2EC|nr:DsrE family protein [Ottowia sp.]HMN20827.1 DsrE family protein [Ottowia sp.]
MKWTLGPLRAAGLATALLLAQPGASADDGFAPYGRARVDMHPTPELNTVWDVNYSRPDSLGALYSFVLHTRRETRGRTVVVTHGPELRAFAIENYEKYQGVVDQMAELAAQGVEFKMCNQALRAAGFLPEDMHGFITVVPIGFAELALWQSRGYHYMNPTPLDVRDVRRLEQP